MLEPAFGPDDVARVEALRAYDVLDTGPEPAFDDIVHLASKICGTPIALISLVDDRRQWFKARVGLDASETPRSISFCGHAIGSDAGVLVVPDAFDDARFADNPLVTGAPGVRFYAGAPLVDPSGHKLGTLCVIDHVARTIDDVAREALQGLARRVVSELRLRQQCMLMEEQRRALEVANRDLKEFTAVAAHDLQSPSRRVAMLVRVIREDLGDAVSQEVETNLELLEKTAVSGVRMVQGMLGLAEVRGAKPDRQSTDLGACVDDALVALGQQRAESGGCVAVESLPTLSVDRNLMSQVFQNLIGNALKFVDREAPRVRVFAEQCGDDWLVSVADNGIGIDQEYLERVFQPFERLHPKSRYPGSGIGLAYCQRVVEKHAGSIWCEPNPDGGSIFRFRLVGIGCADVPVLA